MTDRRSAVILAVTLVTAAAALGGGGKGGTVVFTRPSVAPSPNAKKPNKALAAQQVVQMTNAYRAANGRARLPVNSRLSRTAQAFAEYMARTDRYGHNADGKSPTDRTRAHGYGHRYVLENIAYIYHSDGFTTRGLGQGLFNMWKGSAPHRRSMLDRTVTETGVGIAWSPRTGHFYAVQLFGRPDGK